MNKGIAITGMGIISAIGNDVAENFHALTTGRPGITHTDNIDTVHKTAIKFGEIKKSNAQLVSELGLPHDNNFSRTALLGLWAAKQAVADAGIADINSYRTGLVNSTSVGGMDTTEQHYYQYFEDPETVKYIAAHDGGDVSQKIADELGLQGFVTTISTACSSA
ncbi:MAG: beta-ketoacyl-[acyl-carrier-protein] synthase family protein, partial [Chitinophagaceae bacterium]